MTDLALDRNDLSPGLNPNPTRIKVPWSVPIRVTERSGLARVQEPVTVGVPIQKGWCFEVKALALFDQHSRAQQLQAEVLARWSDGSAKWVLLDFQVSMGANEAVQWSLVGGGPLVEKGEPASISVDRLGELLVVNTGVAQFALSPTIFRPFERVTLHGVEFAGGMANAVTLTDAEGKAYLPFIDRMEVETAGEIRTTVRAQGKLRSTDGVALAAFIARLTFYGQRSDVRLEWTLRNEREALHPRGLWDLGDPHSIYFRDCSIRLASPPGSIDEIEWSLALCGPIQQQCGRSFELYQDSSGGENWQSPNHVNRFGTVTTSFPGYRVTVDGIRMDEGKRATPTIRVRSGPHRLSVAVPQFWENFPKALEVRDDGLNIRLFPGQYSDIFELQPGEQKTHTVFVSWELGDTPSSIQWTHDRLVATVPPDWYEASGALLHLSAAQDDRSITASEMAAERLVEMAVKGENTFFDRRERIDEYGWRNFGDLYADHEAVNWKGEKPLVAHYNNQYDVIYGSIVQFARSGNTRWYDLVRDLARHVVDIDLYHTQSDRPALNGGLFWHTDHYTDAGTATHRSFSITSPQAKELPAYGGGPACEHNYASGLLHYYYLTGDLTAKEAVISLSDWVVNMDDGSTRSLGWLDRRPTGYCSVTATQGFHGPGRGSGNSISVLLDAWLLTGNKPYLSKAEELIRRCIHPHDDIGRRNFDDIEYRWSYTVFLQVLGKYLDLKIERGELDGMYAYAKASLLHYASWMARHEVPYKQVLDRVLIPTETWPAQDIRKSNAFCLAAKHAGADQRALFQQKAELFFTACITDLQSFETHTLTRPLVLLMTNAYIYSYYRQHPDQVAPEPAQRHEFGRPESFKTQFHELYLLRDLMQKVVRGLQAMRVKLSGPSNVTKPDVGGGHA